MFFFAALDRTSCFMSCPIPQEPKIVIRFLNEEAIGVDMTLVEIYCPVKPSEDPEIVRDAIMSIFPDAELEQTEKAFRGTASLDRFSKAIRKQKILDATRSVLIKNMKGDRTRMDLNKQVATVGKVSFSDKRPVLGAIEVTIQDDNLQMLIDKVAPVTVDGEEVLS